MAQILKANSDLGSRDTQDRIVEKQCRNGAEMLGCGAFAVTLKLTNTEVLKVWRLSSPRIEGDGYLSYLQYASKTPSVFHPRAIVSAIIKCRGDGYVGIAKLETLEENNIAHDRKSVLSYISPILTEVRQLEGGAIRRDILESTQSQDTRNLILSLDALYADGNHGPDLHNGNWMLRTSNGLITPVITDPAV